MTDEMYKDVHNPCNGNCRICSVNDMCVSCCRTTEEIALWGDLKPREAELLTEVVEGRRFYFWEVWERSEAPTIH